MKPLQRKPSSPRSNAPSAIITKLLRDFLQDEQLFHHRHRLTFSFLMGILYGLGFIFAVALAVPLTILLLQQVEWVPLIGKLIGEVVGWLSSHAGPSGVLR